MDILRTRLDRTESGNEALRQLNEIRRELDTVKSEAKANEEKARKEIAKLREELAAANDGKRIVRERRRRATRDDDSPPRSPDRKGAGEATAGSDAAGIDIMPGDKRMAEVESMGEETHRTPEYDDERRRREIMPPPSEIPPAIRPPIRGKAKILDDVSMGRHRVRLVDSTSRDGSAKCGSTEGGSRGAARTFMDQITPMLEEWFRGKLLSLDQTNRNEEGSETENRPATMAQRRDKRRMDPVTPTGSGSRNPAAKNGGQQATNVPNRELFSDGQTDAEGRKAGDTEPQRRTRGKQPPKEEWRTVVGRKERKKPPPPTVARPPPAGAGQGALQTVRKGKEQKRNKTTRRKPPRTAAVALTCPPNGYTEAMGMVRKGIDLREIGIQSLRPKRAATGAIILEVPGPDGAKKAETLREKMATVLKDIEGVKVARPVKQGEMRIKRILESTTV